MAWPKFRRKQSSLCTLGRGFVDEENNFIENIYLKVSSRRLTTLRMQAPELVGCHFFEPAIAVDLKGRPLFNPGLLLLEAMLSL